MARSLMAHFRYVTGVAEKNMSRERTPLRVTSSLSVGGGRKSNAAVVRLRVVHMYLPQPVAVSCTRAVCRLQPFLSFAFLAPRRLAPWASCCLHHCCSGLLWVQVRSALEE